jgi:hypothetical protein
MESIIAKILDDGMFIKLLDNTKWAILPINATIACCWLPEQHVEISKAIQGRLFNYKIENVDTGQNVFALKMR